MKKIKDFLKGKKSYLVGAAAIITAVVAFSQDQLTVTQLVEAVFASVMGMTIRAGIAKAE